MKEEENYNMEMAVTRFETIWRFQELINKPRKKLALSTDLGHNVATRRVAWIANEAKYG